MVGRLASEQLSWRWDSCRPLSSFSPVPWKPANTIRATVTKQACPEHPSCTVLTDRREKHPCLSPLVGHS